MPAGPNDRRDTCRRHGIRITACGVPARGLIGGHLQPEAERDPTGSRWRNPRFRGENLARRMAPAELLRGTAEARGDGAAQIVVARVAARGGDIVPLAGARRRVLTADDLAAIDRAAAGGG